MPLPTLRITTAVLATLLAACTALLTVGAAPGSARAAAASSGSRSSNRAAAIVAATALVSQTPVPSGARRSGTEPGGDGHLLARAPDAPASGALIDRHAVYLVHGSLRLVQRFYAGHRPAHVTLTGHGSVPGAGVPANLNLTWAWPATTAAIASRQTVIEIVALPGGATGVRVDAQVIYRVPRPAGERVPAGVTEVQISRATPGQVPDLSRNVTRPKQVRAIISMIDRLPIVQPEFIACPVLLEGVPVVTFSFSASPTGPALATASEQSDVTEPTSACDALMFATGSRSWPSLLGGARFLHQVDQLVHARFATRPGTTFAVTR